MCLFRASACRVQLGSMFREAGGSAQSRGDVSCNMDDSIRERVLVPIHACMHTYIHTYTCSVCIHKYIYTKTY